MDLDISIDGIEIKVQFFIIPESIMDNMDYIILLGFSYFHIISDIYNLSNISISIIDSIIKKKI